MATNDKYIAYRFRIYPDKEQRIYFAKAFGCKRKYWNVCLQKSKNNFTNNNVAKFSFSAKVKTDFPYMKEIKFKTLKMKLLNYNVNKIEAVEQLIHLILKQMVLLIKKMIKNLFGLNQIII